MPETIWTPRPHWVAADAIEKWRCDSCGAYLSRTVWTGFALCRPCGSRYYADIAGLSAEVRRRKRDRRDRVIAAFLDTGASYRETAREVGCSVGTVAGAAARVRAARHVTAPPASDRA